MASRGFGVRVSGLREVQRALLQIPEQIRDEKVADAMRSAAEPMRANAESLAPIGPDAPHLQESIITSGSLADTQQGDSKPSGRYGVRMFVGAKQGGGGQVGPLVEWGSGPRHHESGKYVGEMPAQPFMRPAYDANKRGYIAAMGPKLWAVIRAAVQRVKVK